MSNVFNDWNRYQLTINTSSNPITLNWSDSETLSKYSALQTGAFGGAGHTLNRQLFYEKFQDWAQWQWNQKEYLGIFDLNPKPLIIDIGAGVSVGDLLYAKYNPESKFILIDKDEENFQEGLCFSPNYCFYNTWSPVLDCIKTENLDSTRFNFSDGTDEWPESDCITSFFSWCFHYPKEIYWEKVKNSLKIGGKLALDVRILRDRDVVEEISDEFRSKPKFIEYPNTIPEFIDNFDRPNADIFGYRCVWLRNA